MNDKTNSNIMLGARILIAVFVLLFFILFGRIIYIQASKSVEGQMLTAMAEEKWTKNRTIEANRGEILDRNGEVIAKNVPSYTVYAILDETFTANPDKPRHVVNPKDAAEKLAPILQVDAYELEKRMLKKDVFQVELGLSAKSVSEQIKTEIENLKIPGIGFMKSTKRYYPNGVFASHSIGYVNKVKNSQFQGEMGIENTLDEYMQGVPGEIVFQSDRKGVKMPDPKEIITPPTHGNDVYLTIDQKIQTFLESALSHVEREYEPEKMMAIVSDPKTGEILAMGNRPSFDPNVRDIQNYLNDTIAYRFEPGSTMKVFTLAAAVNEGVFDPNELYQSGSYKISPKIKAIGDHNERRGWGQITFLEGVQRSSNVAFAMLANEKIGTDQLLTYLHRFGFHQKTGIDLPGEVPGNILYRYPLEKITTSFGQGTAITPIQQIQAASAIASDGTMKKPFMVEKILDTKTGEPVLENKPEVVGTPITEDTAKEVRDILETVVSAPEGTGKRYSIDGYKVAGKTGTAQLTDPDTGKYMIGHGNNIFSFLGMAPKEDPKLLIYVAVQKPKLEPTEVGSEPVSYIFRTVMKNSLHYLNVKPTIKSDGKTVSLESIELDSYVGKDPEEIVSSLKEKGLNVITLGNSGKVVQQNPSMNEKVLPGDLILLKREGSVTMPDMAGWSMRDVMKISHILNLKPNVIGNGYVTKQNINPGSNVKERDYLVVELSPPFEKVEVKEEHEESLGEKSKIGENIMD